MIPFRKSIGFRLLGISFILLALPLLVDSFILFQKSYKHAIDDAKRRLVEASHLRESPLSNIQPVNLPFIDLLVYHLQLDENFPETSSPDLNQKLNALAEVGDLYEVFLLKVTPEGRYIIIGGREESIGEDYTDFFRLKNLFSKEAVRRGYEPYIFFDNERLEPYFFIAHPIFSAKTNEVLGILAVSNDLGSQLNSILKADSREFPMKFALVLSSSVILAATDPDLRFQYLKPLSDEYRKLFEKVEPFAAKKLASKPLEVKMNKESPFLEFTWKGKEQVGYLKQISNRNYSLLTYSERSAIFKSPYVDFFKLYSVYLLILILGGGIAYLLTRRMAKPMQALSNVMLGIQKGDLSLRYKKDPLGFEINILGHIFNETIDSLLEKKQMVQEERVKREILARELKLGRDVQRSLLPETMPRYKGVEIAEAYIPAIEVGGDFYDVNVKNKGSGEQLVLAVADASGKGVRACLYSLGVRNILRIYVNECDDLSEAMAKTNNLFCLDTGDTGMFITVIMGIYDSTTGLLTYSSCGHNPALLRRANGSAEYLDHLGIAMGLIPAEIRPPSHTTKLEKGDLLVFYSDGITEAHDESFNQYGEERLKRYLEKEGWRSASEIVKGIVEDVTQFAGSASQHDDITLLIMKIIE